MLEVSKLNSRLSFYYCLPAVEKCLNESLLITIFTLFVNATSLCICNVWVVSTSLSMWSCKSDPPYSGNSSSSGGWRCSYMCLTFLTLRWETLSFGLSYIVFTLTTVTISFLLSAGIDPWCVSDRDSANCSYPCIYIVWTPPPPPPPKREVNFKYLP